MSENGEDMGLDAQDELSLGKEDLDRDLKLKRISYDEYHRRLERLMDRARAEYYGEDGHL